MKGLHLPKKILDSMAEIGEFKWVPDLIFNSKFREITLFLGEKLINEIDVEHFYETSNKNIAGFPFSKGSSLLAYHDNKEVVGVLIISGIFHSHKGNSLFCPEMLEILDTRYDDKILFELLVEAGKNTWTSGDSTKSYTSCTSNYIAGSSKEVRNKDSVWLKWIKNSAEYGIKEWFIFDTDKKCVVDFTVEELCNVWGSESFTGNFRPLINFDIEQK